MTHRIRSPNQPVQGWGRLGLATLMLSTLPAVAAAQPGLLRFERLSVEDGLSHSTVRVIYQDSRGFLWLGTQEGLNRYDGYSFKVFKNDPEDPSSLSENRISALHEDRQGTLWIGTWGGGLLRFRRSDESFFAYRHDPADARSLSHDIVRCILEDLSGTLWVGTVGGLDRLDRRDGTFTRSRQDPSVAGSLAGRSVFALHEDGSGRLWIGTDQGLNRLERASSGESFVSYRHDPSDPGSLSRGDVLAIQEGPEGRLWIATAGGLDRWDPRSETFTHYRHDPSDPASLSEDQVLSLYRDRSGELWIGTASSGLDRFDASSGRFVHSASDPLDPESLSNGSVLSISEDRTGILWFGTYVGLDKYDRSREQFVTYRQRPGTHPTLSSNSIWGILEDSEGVLWVGTYDAGLNRIDRERNTVVHYKPDPSVEGSLPSGEVCTLYEDRSGVLWIGTWGGLSRFDRDRERFTTYLHDPSEPHSLSRNAVTVLYEDRGGRFWVGTRRGLNLFDRAREVSVPYVSGPSGRGDMGRAYVTAIREDRSGALWIGSLEDGLYRFDGDAGDFVRYRHVLGEGDSLGSNSIGDVYEDRSGTLWIGTLGAGLNRLDLAARRSAAARFVDYREKDGLPNDTVLGILEDEEGYLWLSTGDGLSKFDPRSETFRNYNVDDGVQGKVFSTGSSFKSPSGEMFFGGVNGFNAFFPDRIADDPHAPPVVVTDFRLFNKTPPLQADDPDSPLVRSILETRELTLSHRDYVFSFAFAALHFASPKDNLYAYRLEGFDRDWIFTDSTERFAQYSNLAPGEYAFRVKASNNDAVWNEEGASIAVVVLPPPWRTGWALTLYVFTLTAGVLGFVRLQHRKIEREREINRHLREIDKLKDEVLDERTAQVEERERLIAELERKNDELERFNYTVSHDLKSPLVTIKGFVGLMRKDLEAEDTERVASDLDRISQAADTMRKLLDGLFELSRTGRLVQEPEEVALGELAHEVAGLMAGRIAERGVELVIRPELPVVYGDRLRLRETLQILLDNAVSFVTDEKKPRVEIGSRQDGEVLVCYVRDNGIGIDPSYHERIFQLFEQLNPRQDRTGMGLALARRIVELHGGRIWVESEGRGHGSTFCFTLPPGSGYTCT